VASAMVTVPSVAGLYIRYFMQYFKKIKPVLRPPCAVPVRRRLGRGGADARWMAGPSLDSLGHSTYYVRYRRGVPTWHCGNCPALRFHSCHESRETPVAFSLSSIELSRIRSTAPDPAEQVNCTSS
jgi:hypothetical protein